MFTCIRLISALGTRSLASTSARVIIPLDQINVAFSRSSGPGGQNVNKVNTKVEIRFNVDQASWLNDHVKTRLKELQANRINKANEIIVTSMVSRSQHRNLQDALNKLQSYIDDASKVPKERLVTVKPVSAIECRLRDKHVNSVKKLWRRRPIED